MQALFFFHNVRALIEEASGPYFYLPKIESHLEARLWNDIPGGPLRIGRRDF